jgi:hypothetical protein
MILFGIGRSGKDLGLSLVPLRVDRGLHGTKQARRIAIAAAVLPP